MTVVGTRPTVEGAALLRRKFILGALPHRGVTEPAYRPIGPVVAWLGSAAKWRPPTLT